MSLETDAAVILNISPLPRDDRENDARSPDLGAPRIGKDYYINRGLDECASGSSLSSLSGDIANANVSQLRYSAYPDGAEEGIEVDIEQGREATTDIGSSLSSLTNDFGSGRGHRFSPFARLSKFQVQLGDVPDNSFDKDDVPQGVSSPKDGSPWYSVQTKHLSPPAYTNGVVPPSMGSSSTPSSPEVSIPDRELITSKKHLEELVQYPSPPSRSSIWRSSRRISDLDGSRLSNFFSSDYTREISGDAGFASYVRRSFDNSSRRKRWLVGFVVVLFLVCIMAMVAVGLGATQSDDDVEASSQQIDKLGDEDRMDILDGLPYDNPLPDEELLNSSDVGESSALAGAALSTTTSSTVSSSASSSSSEEEPSQLVDPTVSSSTPSTTSTPVTAVQASTTLESSLGLVGSSTETTSSSLASSSIETQTTGNEPMAASTTSSTLPAPVVSSSEAATTSTSTSTTTTSTSTTTTSDSSTISLTAIADTAMFKNRPAKSFNTGPYLTVKGLQKASAYIMFDASSVPRNFVAKATLRLYSITPESFDEDGEAGGMSSVDVDVLPFAGRWDGASISYDNPVLSDAVRVASINVEGYPYHDSTVLDRLQRIHEVDVTSAFWQPNPTRSDVISFMLHSTDPEGRVDFASKEWHTGFGAPELTIESSDTAHPTSPPTRKPSPNPTEAPSTSHPTTAPTKSSSPSPAPTSICENKCDDGRTKKFEKEFAFDTRGDWVDACKLQPDCDPDAKKCEKDCVKGAEKAEERAWKKADEHVAKCKTKCFDINESAPLSPERISLLTWDP